MKRWHHRVINKFKVITLSILIPLGYGGKDNNTFSSTRGAAPYYKLFIPDDKVESGLGDVSLKILSHEKVKRPDSLLANNQFEEALIYYHEAQDYFEKKQNFKGLTYCFLQKSLINIKLRDYQKCHDLLEQVASLIHVHLIDDMGIRGLFSLYQGQYFFYNNLPSKSLESLQNASKRFKNKFGQRNKFTAMCYNYVGMVYDYLLKKPFLAEGFYDRALSIMSSLENEVYEIAKIYYNIAVSSRKIGDNSKAFINALNCLNLIKNNSDNHHYSLLSNCYYLLGNIEYDNAQFSSALEYYKKASSTRSAFGRDTESYYYLNYYFPSIGLVYFELDELDSALYYLKKSLPDQRDVADVFNIGGLDKYFNIGLLYKKKKEYDSAYFYLQRYLSGNRRYFSNRHMSVAQGLLHVGDYFFELKNYDSALIYYQNAIISGTKKFSDPDYLSNPQLEDFNMIHDVFQLLGGKAMCLKKMYEEKGGDLRYLVAAFESFELAVSLLYTNRNKFHYNQSKLNLANHSYFIVEEALECSSMLFDKTGKREYVSATFQYMEQTKYLILLDELKSMERSTKINLSGGLNREQINKRKRVEFLVQQLRNEKDEHYVDSLRNKIIHTNGERDSILYKIQADFPSFFSLNYRDSLINFNKIENHLLKNQISLFEYFWGERYIFLLTNSGDSWKIIKIENSDDLKAQIRAFVGLLEKGLSSDNRKRDHSRFVELAFSVYQSLVRPGLDVDHANDQVKSKILVVPDGMISNFPFEVLVSKSMSNVDNIDYKNLSYLIHNHIFSYSYSSQFYIEQSNKPRLNNNELLAFGFSRVDNIKKNQTDADYKINLPGTDRELGKMSKILDGKYFQGSEATLENFYNHYRNSGIIHLALHGTGDKENRYKSKLMFRGNKQGLANNLYLHDIYNLNIASNLVFLSSCESGIGKFERGEGIFSMARSFIYAGASSVVYSLWKINDNNDVIIENYYNQIKSGNRIDEALHNAKVDYLIKSDEFGCHPSNWAAFIAVGDMKPIRIRERTHDKYLLFFGILLIVVLAVMVLRMRLINN